MLVAIRHGRTSFNEDGSERLRGWLPVPLSPEGEQEAQETANYLKQVNLAHDSLQSSPLKRALQTAAVISQTLHSRVQVAQPLSDWNVGALAGQKVQDTLPLVKRYLAKPEVAPPQGEPYAAFRARCEPFLRSLIAGPQIHLAVTHNRVLTLLKAITEKNDALILERGPVEPGGVVLVKPDLQMHVLFKEREEQHHHIARV